MANTRPHIHITDEYAILLKVLFPEASRHESVTTDPVSDVYHTYLTVLFFFLPVSFVYVLGSEDFRYPSSPFPTYTHICTRSRFFRIASISRVNTVY